jgi:hypothetical protein
VTDAVVQSPGHAAAGVAAAELALVDDPVVVLGVLRERAAVVARLALARRAYPAYRSAGRAARIQESSC